eukprot:CAMPEP_0172208552 /NCGR_PEP_ID=MMETSP1050-20130122/34541_1 /TAXON_ID=233186 /ORGANISM="Cryptomonas curvata, Strain CCAP979/52" /LENGTH=71 /DNA_ID=CAMNT_0012888167 /DNA_START=12 /DNA_END=227 /DNA_ORIENTATION=+
MFAELANTLKGHPASKAHAKADDPLKAAAKLPGMDPSMLKLFKRAMQEQKSHGIEMKGPKMSSIQVDNDDI